MKAELKGRFALSVLGVDVGSFGEQEGDYLQTVAVNGMVEGRGTILVLQVDVATRGTHR